MIDSASVVATAEAPVARRKKTRRKLTFDRVSFFVVFLGLPLSIFLLFVVWPFVQAFYYSLTDWSGFTPDMNFVGLRNYRTLLHDDIFMTAFWNNVLLAVVVPLVTVVLSFVLATMVTVGGTTHGAARGIRALELLSGDLVLPLHDPGDHHRDLCGVRCSTRPRGLVNGILTKLGFDQFASFPWLGDTRTAMPASMFVIIWGFVGFYMVLFVAAIKGIPSDYYDAIRLDGAGRIRTAWSITIPLIRDNVQTAYIYLGILALDAFVYMAGAQPRRRAGQLDPRDAAATAHHGIHEGPVRPRQRDGRGAGPRDPRASPRSSSP